MPIYEYHCDACEHHLEALQGLNDPLLTDCPNCNAAALRKLVSATAFHLKGTGWYATDFRDKPTGHWFRLIPNAWDGEDFCQG
jgi:putative FmdB family regulatory protein